MPAAGENFEGFATHKTPKSNLAIEFSFGDCFKNDCNIRVLNECYMILTVTKCKGVQHNVISVKIGQQRCRW